MHRTGVRRLWALIKALPPDSALHRDGKSWTLERELAALVVERQDMWWSWLAVALGAKPNQYPQGIAFSHPHREAPAVPERPKAKTVRPGDRDEITRFFSRIR